MPSLINELMLAEMKLVVDAATALILVDSSKLNAEDALKFRSDLRKAGGRLKVAKSGIINRLLPAEAAKLNPRGPVGLVCIAGDIAAVAKVVNALVKEEKIILKGGVLEGRALDAKQATKLADLPTREQAAVLLVRTLNAPLVQLVRIVNAKPTELLRVLKVKADEGQKA